MELFVVLFVVLMASQSMCQDGKALSLFSIVQFANEDCTSTEANFPNGTCFTETECFAKNGRGFGDCAAGFGVCCVVAFSEDRSTVSSNNSYLVSPGYPNDHEETEVLTYTISKMKPEICRIKLEFEQFVLTGPNTDSGSSFGQCDTDKMTFLTTRQTNLPSTENPASYGNYPALCGTNTGQHIYLDISTSVNASATITVTFGDTVNNIFKIKVIQFSCDENEVSSQEGCLQYFTGKTGRLTSFNFAGGHSLAGLDYNHCIRREPGMCCIQYTPVKFKLGPKTCSNSSPENICTECEQTSQSETSSGSYVTIPGGANTIAETLLGSAADRHCGSFFNANGYPSINHPIVSCQHPFQLGFVSGIQNVNGPASLLNDGNSGFDITYQQLPGNC